MKTIGYAVFVAIIWSLGALAEAQLNDMPADKVALRYRIERMDKKGKWKPIEAKKTFKRNQNIRFRFMSNESGALYLLNSGSADKSPVPIFDEGSGSGLRRSLGLGTYIRANKVGLWPPQAQGSAVRFTGMKGKERFLFVYVPEQASGGREVIGIAPGAEHWNFDDKYTHMVTGEEGKILFHFFELKSK